MHRLLDDPSVAAFASLLGPARVKAIVDDALARERTRLRAADDADLPSAELESSLTLLTASIRDALEREASHCLVRVVNATGVLLHTNLGRAPLAREAHDAVREIGTGYSNLEYDLDSGARGSRHARVSALACEATGAEDALVVNNCAAAMLLILDTFARTSDGDAREVIVARDQLIEIGGGFRLPDVLARSGARLMEVGTTNKCYVHDYERALTSRTALLLRSHRSNFSIEGFVADVAPSDVARLGARVGVPSVEDLGSGALFALEPYGLPHERTAAEAVADGLDLVAFSGDKLLGGPQAGIIVGRAALVARLRANPLLRALRVDKATLAALGATLRLALSPESRARIPFFEMLLRTRDELRIVAQRYVDNIVTSSVATNGAPRVASGSILDARSAAIVETEALAGGGSLPHARVPSIGIALRGGEALASELRRAAPPIIARLERDAVVFDLRTIARDEDAHVIATLTRLSSP